jgi:serine protease SohB
MPHFGSGKARHLSYGLLAEDIKTGRFNSMWWQIILGVLFLVVLAIIIIKKRKNRRRFIQNHLKHPTGFIQYHEKTETRIKRALELSPDTKNESTIRSIATLEFKGDIQASSRKGLSKLIDEILLNKERLSEVVVCVESPGGSVTDYGHVYAEMCRLPASGLKLTVCVDTVAASGGYLAALPANQILASPFAMVGSIGVVSFIPNIRKLLEKINIEPRTFTAGNFKRTVTLTDEATPEEIEHFKGQLSLIHEQFKLALKRHRPQVDVEKVATGDAWLASTSVEKSLNLVDKLQISSDYLLELNKKHDLVEFRFKENRKNKWLSFLKNTSAEMLEKIFRG